MNRILRVGTLDSAIGSKRLLAVTLWFAVIVCLLTISSVSAAAQVAASVSSNPGVTVSPAAGTTTTTDFCPPVTGKIALTCEDTSTSYDAVNGGATYPCGCPNDDQTGDVSDATGSIHIEIDHDWNATTGWAPPRIAVSSSSVTFDLQGFAYFDCGTNPATSCSQNPSGHWEIHPVTGWKLSTEDFSVSSSPSNLSLFAGTSGSSTVITSGLSGFAGSVA